jgi:hypothetical protein
MESCNWRLIVRETSQMQLEPRSLCSKEINWLIGPEVEVLPGMSGGE